jgi:HAD superfamily hydrolase (TIGR01662 family)
MKVLLDLNGTLVEVAGRRDELFVAGSTWLFLPGAMQAVALLQGCKIPVAIITNQPGSHRDPRTTETDVREFVYSVAEYLKIPDSELFVCTHDDQHRCTCRKPRVSLLRSAAHGYKDVWMVGDSWRDVVAAKWVDGIKSCKVGRFGYTDNQGCSMAAWGESIVAPDLYVPDVLSAARILTGGPY